MCLPGIIRRLAATWFALSLLLGATRALAVGYQCQNADFAILESSIDRTVAEIDFGDPDGPFVTGQFAIAVPAPGRPTVFLSEVDGLVVSPPIEVFGTFLSGLDPSRARDSYLFTFGISAVERAAATFLGTGSNPRIAVVQIEHPAPIAVRTRVRALGKQVEQELTPFAVPLRSAVVNPDVAALLQRIAPTRSVDGPIEDVFARSPRWLRIEVEAGGFVSIDYATLRSALASDVDLIDPLTLRLFGAALRTQHELPDTPGGSWSAAQHLRERPLWVRAAGTTFAAGDDIVAYLPGATGWSDEFDPSVAAMIHDEHPYDDRLAFWLTWDAVGESPGDFTSSPLRMGGRDTDLTPGGRIVTDVRVRSHFEENLVQAFGAAEDDWSWRNLIGDGQFVQFDMSFSGLVADSTAWMHTPLIMQLNGSRLRFFRVQYTMNTSVFAEAEWSYNSQTSPTNAPLTFRVADVPLLEGSNQLTVLNSNGGISGAAGLVVDSFSFSWRRDLELRDAPLRWFVPELEATDERWRYELRDTMGRLGEALVFDTTDPWSAQRLDVNGALPGALDFEVDIIAGQARRFEVVLEDQLIQPARASRHRPRLLRAEVATESGAPSDGWDMVILHPEVFSDGAERMRLLRSRNLADRTSPRVTTVELQDVYDQFGHGTKDPAAIRNYLKFLYEVDRRFSYVLLFGDANRDARGVIPNSVPDFCPAYVQDFFPRDHDFTLSRISFARDEWFVCFHDPLNSVSIFSETLDIADAAIGRFPVATAAEVDRMVQRVIDYEQAPEPGLWRNRVLLAADDEIGLSGPNFRESFHVSEAECLAERVLPPALEVEKFYLTEYPRAGDSATSKPTANPAFRTMWSDGNLIVHYIGHGAPEQLADEVLFRIEDVATLDNGAALPLFLAFSCDVSIFDDPNRQSMSEALVLEPRGGAVATIAATQVTFVSANENLTEAFYTQLYPSPDGGQEPSKTLDRSQPLGVALMAAKWSTPFVQDAFSQSNGAKYVLLGDPALRLRSATESIELGGSMTAALRSGQLATLTARLESSAPGTWYVQAAESADSVVYVMDFNPAGSTIPAIDLPYVFDGSSYYRGAGSFAGGQFEAEVRSPAVMRFGDQGRVRVLMEVGTELFVGLIDSLDVIRDAIDTDDQEGPRIALEFAQGARSVQPGSVLVATIEDASGVNVLGTTPANSILLEVDQSQVTVDVTSQFQLDDGSSTRGTLQVPLPEGISPGDHTLELSAGDMLSNVSVEEINFVVVAGGSAEIGAHAPIPNPFSNGTQFVLDLISPVGLPSEIEIDIRTVGGRPVRVLRAQLGGGGGRLVVPWDGLDRRGDEIANGSYLYIVRARFATDPPVTVTSTGRVVLMR